MINPPKEQEHIAKVISGLRWRRTTHVDSLLDKSGVARPIHGFVASPDEAFWSIYKANKTELRALGVYVGKTPQDIWLAYSKREIGKLDGGLAGIKESRATESSLIIPAPDGCEYLPFQRAAVQYSKTHRNVMLGDEMGLGKTLQAIGAIQIDPNIWRVLVVCPAYLKINWQREIEKWYIHRPNQVIIINAKDEWPEIKIGDKTVWVIINYDILHRYTKDITRFDACILDECHAAKGRSRRTEAVKSLRNKVGRWFALSGTPALNRPVELFNILNLLCPTEFPNFFQFAKRYCGGHSNPWGGIDASGCTNAPELQARMRASCFPAGTMVSSEHGRIPIERIVEGRIQTRVWSRDAMGTISLKPVISINSRTHDGIFIKICTPDASIVCTPDHRIYTTKGEKRADQINESDHLLHLQWEGNQASEKMRYKEDEVEHQAGVLHALRRSSGLTSPEGKIQKNLAGEAVKDRENLQGVRSDVLCKERSQIQQKDVLHGALQGDLHVSFIREGCPSYSEGEKSKCCIENQRKEAKGKEGTLLQGESYASPRGHLEAKAIQEAVARTTSSNPKTQSISGSNRGSHKTREQVNVCGPENRKPYSGGGWAHPCAKIPKKAGQGEGLAIVESRVLSVEILELGHRRKDRLGFRSNQVYDIEVEGNHNYFADELLVHNCMIRRLKSEVLKELPPKRRQIIELPALPSVQLVLEEEKRIWKLHEDTVAALRERRAIAEINDNDEEYIESGKLIAREFSVTFQEMARLRLKLAEHKVPIIHSQVSECLDSGIEKISVFWHHKSPAKTLEGLLQKEGVNPLFITGDISAQERQEVVDAFQRDSKHHVIIGTIGAMGTGFTLTASSHAIFGELDWRPGILAQAEDRHHRIGQVNPVLIQYLLFADSLDAKMINSVIGKMDMLKDVLDRNHEDEDALDFFGEDEKVVKKRPPLKGIQDEEERKTIHRAICLIAANDSDLAKEINGVGFSKWDSFLGHRLANENSLSPRAAALAKRLVYKYRKQLPEEIINKIQP